MSEVAIEEYYFPSTLEENETKDWIIRTYSTRRLRHAVGIWNSVNNSGDIYVNGARIAPGCGWLAHTGRIVNEFTFRDTVRIPHKGNYEIVITAGYYDGEYHWNDNTTKVVYVKVTEQPSQPTLPPTLPVPQNMLMILTIAFLAGVIIGGMRR